MTLKLKLGSKELRHTVDTYSSGQIGQKRKEIVYLEKILKINHGETSLWIYSSSFMFSFNKTCEILSMFQKKISFAKEILGMFPILSSRFYP